jgi:hypothetical protein
MISKPSNFVLALSLILAFSISYLSSPLLQASENPDTSQSAIALSKAELERLLGPIALYPDVLLQQMLAASTFPEQIIDAAMYNELGKDPKGISAQTWDESVKAIANYPSVLTKLAVDLEWTISLGTAFINQTDQVIDVLQALRARAKALGNLKSSDMLAVIEETDPKTKETIIRIEAVDPQVFYVPASTELIYDAYVSRSDMFSPVATFGLGMALGYAVSEDDDDEDDIIYYGGYYGPGFWHYNGAAEDWLDHRRDRVEHYNNNTDNRRDLFNKQQEWRKETQQRGSRLSPVQRANAATQAKNSNASWSSTSPVLRDPGSNSLATNSVKPGDFSSSRIGNYSKASSINSKQASSNYGGNYSRSDSINRDRTYQRSNTSSGYTSKVNHSKKVQQRFDNAMADKGPYSTRRAGGAFNGINSGGRSINTAQSRGFASRGGGGFRGGGGGRR